MPAPHVVVLIVGVVLGVLATINVTHGRFNTGAAALTCIVLAMLLGATR